MALANLETALYTFRTQLLTVVTESATPIAWDGEKFPNTPATNPPPIWFDENLLIADEGPASTGMNQTLGQYRVEAVGLKGGGMEAVNHWARTVANAFDVMSLSGILLDRVRRESKITDSGPSTFGGKVWVRVPVVVEWRMFTAKG